MPNQIPVPSEFQQLIKEGRLSEAKQLVQKHLKSDKNYLNLDVLFPNKETLNYDKDGNILIANYRNIWGLFGKEIILGCLMIIAILFSLFSDFEIPNGFFVIVTVIIGVSIFRCREQFLDRSTKVSINKDKIIFNLNDYNQEVRIDEILMGFAGSELRGSRSNRVYFYLTFFFKDPSKDPVEINVSGLEFDSFQIGSIIHEKITENEK